MDVLHDASDSKSDKPFDPETLGRAQALLEAIQEFDPEKQTHDSWNGKTSHSDAADETVQSSASEEQARSAEQEEEIFHNDTTPRYTKEIHTKEIHTTEIQDTKITKHKASAEIAESLHQLNVVIMQATAAAESNALRTRFKILTRCCMVLQAASMTHAHNVNTQWLIH